MHKLIGSLLVVVLVATIGLGWGLDQLFFGLTKRDDDPLTAYRVVGRDLASLLDGEENKSAMIERWQSESRIGISLMDADELRLPQELKRVFFEGEAVALESDTGVELYYYLRRSDAILAVEPPAVKFSISQVRIRLFMTVAFYAGLIAFTLVWLYPLVRRLSNLSKVARDFGDGNLSRRIRLSKRSYISDIEREFNRMAQRIETLVDDNKLLSGAVSHDLRTPLSRLRFGIDALNEFDDPGSRQKFMLRISDDLSEMENLVEVLLNFAKLDRRFDQVEKKDINLGQWISGCVDAYHAQSPVIKLLSPQTETSLYGHEQYLSMMLNNLLQNAVRYCDKQIHVSSLCQANEVAIVVADDGPGIVESERESMLKPFVRQQANSSDKGYGMGLAIVRRIVLAHDGAFFIESSESLGGASMRVVLPLR